MCCMHTRNHAHTSVETTPSAWGKVLLYGKHKYCVEFVRPLAFVPFPSEAQLLVQQVSVSTHARARAREGQCVCVCVCVSVWVCGCVGVWVSACACACACVCRAR